MTAGERFSLEYVKALWALSELKSPRTIRHYRDSKVLAFREQLGTTTLRLEDSASPEFRMLLEMFEDARGKFLHMYLNGISEFVFEMWSVERLREIRAMLQMDPLGEGRLISVLAYSLSPPPEGTDDGDPRVAAALAAASDRPFQVNEPVIVGLYDGSQVLIDGYYRILMFMRSAGAQDRIPVLAPVPRP